MELNDQNTNLNQTAPIPPSPPLDTTATTKKPVLWTLIAAAIIVIGGGVLIYMMVNKPKPVVKQIYKVGFMSVDQAVQETSTALKHSLSLAQKSFETETVAVNIITKETSCDGETAAKAMSEFAAEGVVAVVGELCSDATLAAAPIANQKHIPLISPASTSPKVTNAGEYVYRTIPSDALYTDSAAKVMYNDHNVRKLAVIHSDDSYGNGTAEGLKTAIEKLGGSVVVDKTYGQDQTDLTKEMTAVKDSGADGLFIVGVGGNDIILLKRQELGVTIPTFGPDYLKDPALLESAGDAAEGIFIVAASNGTQAFSEKYQAAYKETPPAYAAQAYDAMAAIMKGLQQGATTGQTLKTKLDSLSFDGVTGRIVFDNNGDVSGNYEVFTIKDGRPLLLQ